MAVRIALKLILIVVVIIAAIVGYNSIDLLPLRQDMMGDIVEGCLRAADIATAAAIVIALFRRTVG